MRNRGALIIPAIGLLVGLGIGYVDSRPTWDDTGMTAGALLLVAAVLAAVRPSVFWLTGLAVGMPVFAMSVFTQSNYGSVMALAIGLVGSLIGRFVGKHIASGGGRHADA